MFKNKQNKKQTNKQKVEGGGEGGGGGNFSVRGTPLSVGNIPVARYGHATVVFYFGLLANEDLFYGATLSPL